MIIADNHKKGLFHIQDLGFLSVYCVGWDLEDLLLTGFKGVESKAQSNLPLQGAQSRAHLLMKTQHHDIFVF